MFTFILIYIIFYLFIFLSIFILIYTQIPFYIFTNLTTGNFMIFWQKYKNIKSIFLWLLFSLTGLPPVGLFFVKFNIFLFLLYNTNFISIFFLFFFFFINMLFYLQVFHFRNFKKRIYHLITPENFCWWKDTNISYSYVVFYILTFIINILFFLFFLIFLFSDYYIILFCFIVNNKSKRKILL